MAPDIKRRSRAKGTGTGKHRSSTGPSPAQELPELSTSLEALCKLIQRHTGHDFSQYKKATLLRRIRRRLQGLHVTAVADYLQLLASSAAEAEALVKDLLIGVTQFFRDPETFDTLSRLVLPRIIDAKGEQSPCGSGCRGAPRERRPIRLPCSLRELLDRGGRKRAVQIFATEHGCGHLGRSQTGPLPVVHPRVDRRRAPRTLLHARR